MDSQSIELCIFALAIVAIVGMLSFGNRRK